MARYLIYNFSGEIDDLSHLFPNERLAQIAAIIRDAGGEVEIWDRGNIRTLSELAPAAWKRGIAAFAGDRIFRKLSRNRSLNALEKMCFGLPLKWTAESMGKEIDRNYLDFMRAEAQRVLDGGFDAVILNLWQGGFDESMKLAEWIKDRADIPIYATGQRVDWFDTHVLSLFKQIDAVILGLGYETLRRLTKGEPIRLLPDVGYRSETGEIVKNARSVPEMDGLPHPLYDADVYKGIEHLIPLYHVSLSNQACPNRCAFCPRPYNYGRKVRRKPIDQVVDEVAALREKGVRHFRIADSTPPPGLLTDFARGIVDRGLHERDVSFTAFSRVDQNRHEDFGLMRKANFVSLFFGLESLDDEGLKRIRKGTTYHQIRETLAMAKQAGFFVVGSLIFPLPHESESSRDTTFARLRELAPVLDSVLIQPAGIYPISDWGLHPHEFGIHLHPGYIETLMNYPVKFIIPMRFWPPFPFAYPIMGKPAEQVTFDDIRETYETFSSRVWKELDICNVQDYTLLVANMVNEDPYRFTDRIKEVLVTRNYDELKRIVMQSRRHVASAAGENRR